MPPPPFPPTHLAFVNGVHPLVDFVHNPERRSRDSLDGDEVQDGSYRPFTSRLPIPVQHSQLLLTPKLNPYLHFILQEILTSLD